ncbi:MAG: hypothetical protein HZC28_12195 [Spirochaetes bacterium]|nr:hypothetical protein [Spirochaetota bacterium]
MKKDLFDEIMELPVWDTHTHLESSPTVCARDIWDIMHYYWFKIELEACGYPRDAEKLNEPERFEALAKAMEVSRTTYWNRLVRIMMKDLFGATIHDAASYRTANERILATAREKKRGLDILKRVHVTKVVTAAISDTDISDIREVLYVVPVFRNLNDRIIDAVANSLKQRTKADEMAQELDLAVQQLYDSGCRTIRLEPYPFEHIQGNITKPPVLADTNNSRDAIVLYLGHALLSSLQRRSFHIQLFLGIWRGGQHVSSNNPWRIPVMNDIFEKYPGLTFELINAAELSALDMVQSARALRNVYPGGLWWHNFRASTYRLNMQYRLEALPATRSILLASDSRHIEWLYGKTLFVKRLLAEFLNDQVKAGWLDTDAALYVARQWLYDTAAKVYRAAS